MPDKMFTLVASGIGKALPFFDVRVFHPNAESYKDLTIQQLHRKHEDEKKRVYANRVLEVEQRTFTPLVFTTTGGMAVECKRFHSRLAELIAIALIAVISGFNTKTRLKGHFPLY